MELPQPRPYGTEGTAGRKATHDFLSLYSHSTVQQDPSPPSQAGAYLKTHDFLQPLECMGRTTAKEESRTEVSTIEKPPPPAPPPSVEHILPGGIGTYTISHISYFNQRVPKPEGTIFTVAQASNTDKNDDNSNCSSYSGGGFTLWQESSAKKGKTGKENSGERPIARDGVEKLGQWTPDRPAQSSSNNHCNSFSSLSSSQPLGKKSQSFMDMIKSAKVITQDEDMDDDQEFVLKKEVSSTNKGELKVRVDGKSSDQKANTPRSKHSATEQRRRSKINDRFQMLRELIPHSDQKRDKASFLLEVIEYIQYLQEKVHKYDGSYQGWNNEPTKLMPWKNNHRPAESFVDPSPGINSGPAPALVFSAKLEEKNVTVSPNILGSVQNTVESDMSTATTFKSIDHRPGTANKAATFPISVQPNIFALARNGGALIQFQPTLPSESENLASQPQHQSCQTRSCTTDGAVASDKMKEQGLTIEGGMISISSVYSQGLLNTLTQALQSSGVDLSQASISVQIELGKRATVRASTVKDDEVPSKNQGTTRCRVTSGDGSDQALKKVKTSRS